MICKNFQLYLFSLFFFITPYLFTENKIVYLISPPRSLSTAFLRMIEARNDFTIINEPSIRVNDSSNTHKFHENTLTSFKQVKEKILKESQTSNVFIKEISQSVRSFLIKDKDLPQQKNVYFVFLVRNPHHSTISFYNKLLRCFHGFDHAMGYKYSYELLQHIQKNSPNKPLIILSENLYQKPEETIKKFCSHVGIENKPEALQWQDLGDNFTGIEEWSETKQQNQAYHWHGDAIRSSEFITPHSYMTDEEGIPTFEEISNDQHREMCRQAYYENLTYYNLILQEIDYL